MLFVAFIFNLLQILSNFVKSFMQKITFEIDYKQIMINWRQKVSRGVRFGLPACKLIIMTLNAI